MVSPASYSTKLQRHAGEQVDDFPGKQVDAFLRLCIAEGLDDDTIIMLCRDHQPSQAWSEGTSDWSISRRLPKVRQQMAEDGSLPPTRSPQYLNWAEALEQALPDLVWCVEGKIEQGESASLVGPSKIGKSLLSLELAACKASGRDFLGRELTPGEVLYLDWENRPDTVVDRVRRMGFQAADLGRLHYETFPSFGTLDTEAGASAALQRIEDTGADLVVLDTLQRVLQGEESSSLSIRDMYRFFSMELRRRGVSVLRLDHLGKDARQGARGSSAKADDVDQVWELSRPRNEPFVLRGTHSRSRRSRLYLQFDRTDDPLRHVLVSKAFDADQQDDQPTSGDERGVRRAGLTPEQLAEHLDELGVDADSGRPKAEAALRTAGLAWRTDALALAVRMRKSRS